MSVTSSMMWAIIRFGSRFGVLGSVHSFLKSAVIATKVSVRPAAASPEQLVPQGSARRPSRVGAPTGQPCGRVMQV